MPKIKKIASGVKLASVCFIAMFVFSGCSLTLKEKYLKLIFH